jgi:hypothetical protein
MLQHFPRHTLSESLILQHIERSELGRVHALKAQDLDAGPREPALRRLWRTLHKQNHRCRCNGLVDRLSCFRGQESRRDKCESRVGESGGKGWSWSSSLPECL